MNGAQWRDQWRELIESYVLGRLSADSFRRRFLEAFASASRAPPAVQDLYFIVEAYAGDPTARGHDVVDDAELMLAARRALLRLEPIAEEPPRSPPPYEEAGGPEPMSAPWPPRSGRRGPPLQAPPGLAFGLGIGCVLVALWFGVGVLQVFAIAEQVDRVAEIGPVLSTLAGLVMAFVPVLGSVIAFFGAVDGWGWPTWVGALVFLAFPLAVQTSSFLAWRRRRP